MDDSQTPSRPTSKPLPRTKMNATTTRLQELQNILGQTIVEEYSDDLYEKVKENIQFLIEEEKMTEEEGETILSQYEGGKVSLNLSFTNNNEQK